jgi:hypothetical protein
MVYEIRSRVNYTIQVASDRYLGPGKVCEVDEVPAVLRKYEQKKHITIVKVEEGKVRQTKPQDMGPAQKKLPAKEVVVETSPPEPPKDEPNPYEVTVGEINESCKDGGVDSEPEKVQEPEPAPEPEAEAAPETVPEKVQTEEEDDLGAALSGKKPKAKRRRR